MSIESPRLPSEIVTELGVSQEDRRRAEVSHRFRIEGGIDTVFGLFDPVSELDWVDDWDPTPVHPQQLSRAVGSVFTLVQDGRTAVWTVLRHSPVQHVAEYLVIEHDYQHRWIDVSCSEDGDSATMVCVRYVTTALSVEGQRDLERYGKSFLEGWREPVQAAVAQLAIGAAPTRLPDTHES